MCNIPAGSGFGGLNSLVTMGANVLPGRNFCSKCITGPLETSQRLISLWTCKGGSITRNFWYISPSVRLCSRGTLSARSDRAGALVLPLRMIRWHGWRLGLAPERGGGVSICGRGCRLICRWRGRRWRLGLALHIWEGKEGCYRICLNMYDCGLLNVFDKSGQVLFDRTETGAVTAGQIPRGC